MARRAVSALLGGGAGGLKLAVEVGKDVKWTRASWKALAGREARGQKAEHMSYVVTRGIGAAVVEVIPTLEAALERAGALLSDNYAYVAIHDGKGNRVTEDDVLSCYLGVTKLTPDLRVVDNPPSGEK